MKDLILEKDGVKRSLFNFHRQEIELHRNVSEISRKRRSCAAFTLVYDEKIIRTNLEN